MLHWKLVLMKKILGNRIGDYMNITTFIALYHLMLFLMFKQ